MNSWVIKINVVAIALWYVLLPFAGKLAIFSLGGTVYDLSRVIGLVIIYGNTLFLPTLDFRRIPVPVMLSSMIFIGYAMLLLAKGANFPNAVNVLVRIYSGFLLLIVFCGFKHHSKMEIIERLLLFMGAFTAIYTLGQFAFYKASPQQAISFFGERAFVASYSTVRPMGPLLSAGGSASVITIAFILLLKRLIIGDFRRLHLLISGIMALALLVNLTRTYIFMLVLITFVCLIFYRRFTALMTLGVGATMLILVSFAVVSPSHYLDRFKDVPGVAAKDVSNKQLMQGRGLLMDLVWSDFKNKDIYRKLTGDGLYYTNKLLGKYFSVAEASTHNDFLWLLSNMGIFGLGIYIIFYLTAAISYKGNFQLLFLCYLFGIMFFSGFGGETICVTGHRLLQVICLAYFYAEGQNKEADIQV